MRKVTTIVFAVVVAMLLAFTTADAESIKVKQSFSGTAIRTGYDMNEDPAVDRGATFAMWYGKGTLGPFTGKFYFDIVTFTATGTPDDPDNLCGGAYLCEIDTNNLNDPLTAPPNTFEAHIQEFKNGDLLYWAVDTSLPHPDYFCFDPFTYKLTRTTYFNYDGGTGRFAGAKGDLMWHLTIETRVADFMYGIHGIIEGMLELDD